MVQFAFGLHMGLLIIRWSFLMGFKRLYINISIATEEFETRTFQIFVWGQILHRIPSNTQHIFFLIKNNKLNHVLFGFATTMSNLFHGERKRSRFQRLLSSADLLWSLFSPLLCDVWQKIRSLVCLIMLSLLLPGSHSNHFIILCFPVSFSKPISIYLPRSVFPPASESWLKAHGHPPAPSCLNTPSLLSVRPNNKTQPAFTEATHPAPFPKIQGQHLFGILAVCTTRNEFVVRITHTYEWPEVVSGCLIHKYIFRKWKR